MINLEQIVMSQIVTFVSFVAFYLESDVKSHIWGYVSTNPFAHRFLDQSLDQFSRDNALHDKQFKISNNS